MDLQQSNDSLGKTLKSDGCSRRSAVWVESHRWAGSEYVHRGAACRSLTVLTSIASAHQRQDRLCCPICGLIYTRILISFAMRRTLWILHKYIRPHRESFYMLIPYRNQLYELILCLKHLQKQWNNRCFKSICWWYLYMLRENGAFLTKTSTWNMFDILGRSGDLAKALFPFSEWYNNISQLICRKICFFRHYLYYLETFET